MPSGSLVDVDVNLAAGIARDFSMMEVIEFEEKFLNIVDCFVWMRLFKSHEKQRDLEG